MAPLFPYWWLSIFIEASNLFSAERYEKKISDLSTDRKQLKKDLQDMQLAMQESDAVQQENTNLKDHNSQLQQQLKVSLFNNVKSGNL